MICCVVLLVIAGAARAVMLTLLPGRSRHERTPFPPPARRIVENGQPSRVVVPPAATAIAPVATRRRNTGTGLVGIGLAWFVAGIVGMHVLGIVPSAVHSSAWRDVAFHLSGPLVASVGLVLRSPVTARRPARPSPQLTTRTTS